ncbi:hypothetical protein [Desulfitobacterium hafniense]|nr:hypothetical protein [Desulfitobacterium hafniense]
MRTKCESSAFEERFGRAETWTRVSPKPPRHREWLSGAGPDGAEVLSD